MKLQSLGGGGVRARERYTNLESIPDVTVVVIVTGEENPTRGGEGDGGDSAEDVVVNEGVELAVGSEVEELA